MFAVRNALFCQTTCYCNRIYVEKLYIFGACFCLFDMLLKDGFQLNFKNSFHFPFAIRYYLFVQHSKWVWWVDAVFRFAIRIEKISIRQTTERNAQQMHVVFLFLCFFFKSKESSGAVLHSSLTFLARALHSLCCQPHFFGCRLVEKKLKMMINSNLYQKPTVSDLFLSFTECSRSTTKCRSQTACIRRLQE